MEYIYKRSVKVDPKYRCGRAAVEMSTPVPPSNALEHMCRKCTKGPKAPKSRLSQCARCKY